MDWNLIGAKLLLSGILWGFISFILGRIMYFDVSDQEWDNMKKGEEKALFALICVMIISYILPIIMVFIGFVMIIWL